jgi:hypothetical protein
MSIYIGDLRIDIVEICPDSRTNYTTMTECRGGKIMDFSGKTAVVTDEDCPTCKGRGEVLTLAGREIVRVVRAFWEDELE